MKHHEYQIYYGGFKIKLKGIYFCKQCGTLISKNHTKRLTRKNIFFKLPYPINVPSHKKQTDNPRDYIRYKNVIQEKN